MIRKELFLKNLVLAIALVFIFNFVIAATNDLSNVEEKFEKLESTINQIDRMTKEDVKNQYLSEELPKIIKNNTAYISIKKIYSNNSEWIDSLSYFFIGMKPVLKAGFVLAVFIFLSSLIWFFNLSYLIYLAVPTKISIISRRSVFLILVLISSLLSLSGYLSFFIIKLYNSVSSSFLKFIFFLMIFAIAAFIDIFCRKFRRISIAKKDEKAIDESKKLSKEAKKEAKEAKKSKEESEDTNLSEDAKYSKAYLEELGKTLKKRE